MNMKMFYDFSTLLSMACFDMTQEMHDSVNTQKADCRRLIGKSTDHEEHIMSPD